MVGAANHNYYHYAEFLVIGAWALSLNARSLYFSSRLSSSTFTVSPFASGTSCLLLSSRIAAVDERDSIVYEPAEDEPGGKLELPRVMGEGGLVLSQVFGLWLWLSEEI